MPGTAAPAWTTSLIIHAVSKRPATKSAHHGLHGISRAALDYFGTPKSFSIAPVGRSPPSARVTRSARRPAAFAPPPSRLPPSRLPPGALRSDPRVGLAYFGRPRRFLIAPSPRRPAALPLSRSPGPALGRSPPCSNVGVGRLEGVVSNLGQTPHDAPLLSRSPPARPRALAAALLQHRIWAA
ncbi:hypothetical protein B0H14DRAFT_3422956 [Mycena olivaceomarginata]|nr:hypothetical protein B0H14DRAFT_3422956 [Mycena olivaceomarginata]